MSPPFPGSNNKTRKKPARSRQQADEPSSCWFLFGLFFDPEDGSDTFLRKFVLLSADYTAFYLRRYNS
jgi:hypothetical protein